MRTFIVYLFVASLSEPWRRAYTFAAITDSIIVIHSIVSFISSHGRPPKWIVQNT